MRKFILSAIVLILSLAPCTFVNPEPPYGVWESSDPNIVMDINPESGTEQVYEATYTPENGEAMILSAAFNQLRYFMIIGERHADNGGVRTDYYFAGEYKTKGDKLTLSLTSQEFAKTAYKEITFTRTKDYEEES